MLQAELFRLARSIKHVCYDISESFHVWSRLAIHSRKSNFGECSNFAHIESTNCVGSSHLLSLWRSLPKKLKCPFLLFPIGPCPFLLQWEFITDLPSLSFPDAEIVTFSSSLCITSDTIRDLWTYLSDEEREKIKRSLLSILVQWQTWTKNCHIVSCVSAVNMFMHFIGDCIEPRCKNI